MIQALLETVPASKRSLDECTISLHKLAETLDGSVAEVTKIREIFGAGFDDTGALLALLEGYTQLEKAEQRLAQQRDSEVAKATEQSAQEQEQLAHECKLALEACEYELSTQLARLEMADEVWGDAELAWRRQCASKLENPAEIEKADCEFSQRRKHATTARVALTHQKLFVFLFVCLLFFTQLACGHNWKNVCSFGIFFFWLLFYCAGTLQIGCVCLTKANMMPAGSLGCCHLFQIIHRFLCLRTASVWDWRWTLCRYSAWS